MRPGGDIEFTGGWGPTDGSKVERGIIMVARWMSYRLA